MKDLKKIIKDTTKAYRNLAEIQVENNYLVNRNRATGALHPFSDGRERIPLGKSQMVRINELLK